jgi:type I restriction enzyme R subunit
VLLANAENSFKDFRDFQERPRHLRTLLRIHVADRTTMTNLEKLSLYARNLRPMQTVTDEDDIDLASCFTAFENSQQHLALQENSEEYKLPVRAFPVANRASLKRAVYHRPTH